MAQQNDFIVFICANSLLGIAIVCFCLNRLRTSSIPWLSLGCAMLLYTMEIWLRLFSFITGDPYTLQLLRALVTVFAFAFLADFALALTVAQPNGKKRPRWPAIVIGLAALLPGVAGVTHTTTLQGLFLGICAGFWAMLALSITSWKISPEYRKRILVIASGLGIYVLAMGTPLYPIPYSPLHYASDLPDQYENFLAPAVRAVASAGLLFGFGAYYFDILISQSPMRGLYLRRGKRLLFAVLIVVLAVGWGITGYMGYSGDLGARAKLQMTTLQAAQSVSSELIAQLSGTVSDASNPVFQQVKQSLEQIKNKTPDFRNVYLVGRRDGGLYISADAEPIDSKDYAPPGTSYADAPPKLADNFGTGELVVVGPYVDKWGSWVSGFVPVRLHDSGQLAAYLGMDVSAKNWNRWVAEHRFWGMLICLGLMIILPGFLVFRMMRADTTTQMMDLQERFRKIFNIAPEAIYIFEVRSRRLLEVNDFMCNLLGYARHELTGMALEEIVVGDPDVVQMNVDTVLKNGMARMPDHRYRRRDGSEVSVEVTAAIIQLLDDDCVLVFARDITQRKQSEEALREQTEIREAFFDSLPGMVFCKSRDLVYQMVNHDFAQRLGMTPDQIAGKTDHDLFPPEAAERTRVSDLIVIESNTPQMDLEEDFTGHDGLKHWQSTNRTPFHDRAGTVVGLVGISLDITERKRAEDERRTMETLSRQLTSTVTSDEIGRAAVTASRSIFQHDAFGFSIYDDQADKIVGIYYEDIMPGETQPREVAKVPLFTPGINSRRVLSGEPLIINRSKSPSFDFGDTFGDTARPSRSILHAPIMWQGQALGMMSVHSYLPDRYNEIDLMLLQSFADHCGGSLARVLADQKLREMTMHQQAILDSAPYAIIVTDIYGLIVLFNHAAEKMLGWKAEDVIGKLTPEAIHSADEMRAYAQTLSEELGRPVKPGFNVFTEKPASDSVEEREWSYIRKDGSKCPVLLSVAALRDKDHSTTGYLGIAIDITEQKRVQQELSQREQYLQAVVEVQKRLLAGSMTDNIYDQALPVFGRTSGASRIYVFENHKDKHGRMLMSRRAEWCAPDIHPEIDNPQLQNLSYDDFFPRWAEILSRGGIINDIIADCPESERQMLEPQGIISILILPLMVNGEFYGFIGIDNCVSARSWTPLEVNLLRAAANAVSLAYERRLANEMRWRLLGILEATPDLVATADINQKIIYMNAAGRSLAGIPAEADPGKYFIRDFLDDESYKKLMGEALPTAAEKGAWSGETVVTGNTGQKVPMLQVMIAHKNAAGDVEFISIVARDISERKRFEEQLIKTTSELQAIFDAIPDLFFRFNANGVYLDYKASSEIDLYIHPKQFLSQRIEDILPADVAAQTKKAIHQTIEAGKLVLYEYSLPMESGSQDFEARLVPFQKNEVIAIVRNVTEQKAAQRQIHLQAKALEAAANGIAIVSREGIIRWINPALSLITGWSVKDAVGHNPQIFRSGKQNKEFYRNMWATILDGRVWHGELINRRKDGSLYFEEMTITPIYDETGRIIDFIVIKQDVTQRKHTEQELIEAKQAAEAADSAKSDFLANMSHEIRTPMNGVIGMTDLLQETSLTPEQHEYVETIISCGQALMAVINDILDFSKIEAGKLELESIEFDLRDCVDEVGDILRPTANEKGLVIAILAYHDIPVYVKGDPMRLRQVLLNLVNNAIKFTQKGEILVRALADDITDRHIRMRFFITDTGIGIPHERLSRLFRPFSQVDTSTTRRFGGSGLGLAICHQLVKLMGGEIGVASEPGKGSTFWFTAAFERCDSASRLQLEEQSFGLRVLAVDDNQINRKILMENLKLWKCECSEAGNGDAALKALRDAANAARPYDLVLMDYQMPGMDGVEAARQVKSDPLTSSTHLIMLSSIGWQLGLARMTQLGFDACLTKPVRRVQLRNAIECAIGKRIPGTIFGLPQAEQDTATQEAGSSAPKALILLAEDNLVNQRVAVRVLEKAGHRCDVVSNGMQALDAIKTRKYDLVLMDCQMPDMDGYEATRCIRQYEAATGALHIPIIAMTAHAMEGAKIQCLEAGMDDYVSKPIKSKKLFEVIGAHLHKTGDNSVRPNQPDPSAMPDKPASTPSQPSPIDYEWLDQCTSGDREAEKEILDLFAREAQKQLTLLKQAIAAGDCAAVRKEGHSLKGAAGNVGAMPVKEAAAALEIEAAAGNHDGMKSRFASLCSEFRRFESFYEERTRQS